MKANRIHVTVAIVFLVSIGVPGCINEFGPVDTDGRLAGDIYGRMLLQDIDSTIITDNSGITITVAGTSRNTMSERNGWWKIVGLKAGTYTLIFSKPGYGTYKFFGFQHIGGDSLYIGTGYLGNVARFYVDSFTTSVDSDSTVHFAGIMSSVAPTQYSRYAMVFVDTSGGVSSTHYIASFTSYLGSSKSFSLNYATSELVNRHGLQHGSQIHCVAYGFNDSFVSAYFDPTLRVTVYPTLSPIASEVATVRLP